MPQEGSPLDSQRKIARSASLVVVVEDLNTAAAQLRQTAALVGGQVISENLVSLASDETTPEEDRIMPTSYSTVVLSVPADQLERALEEASKVGEVTTRTISAEDVTTQVVDVEARIKTMRESIVRVRALMERAGTLTEIAALEAELTRRQADLESLLAQQAALANMVEQSTIMVSLMTRRQAEGIASGGFLAGLEAGWEAFLASGRVLITLLGAALPFLLAGAVVVAPLLWWRKRRASRVSGPQQPAASDRARSPASPPRRRRRRSSADGVSRALHRSFTRIGWGGVSSPPTEGAHVMPQVTAPPRKPPTRAEQRRRSMRRLTLGRRVVQLGVAGIILVAAVRHQVEKQSGAASVDALCPFGAVETLITLLTTGELITKVHTSNLVLGVAVLVSTLLVGNAFCGWICPFGTLQDGLWWLARTLRMPQFRPGASLDRVLRWGRFVVLGVVLWFSVTTARLWFADFDPYVTIFGLGWLFEPGDGLGWALVIAAVTVGGSLVVERFWCRYLCPFGAVFTVLGRLSFLRIRRTEPVCTDCTLCDRPCPVGLTVSKADPLVSTDCIGCMDCVAACPVKGALGVSTPVFLGGLQRHPEPVVASRVKQDGKEGSR